MGKKPTWKFSKKRQEVNLKRLGLLLLGLKDNHTRHTQAHSDISCCAPTTGPHLHPRKQLEMPFAHSLYLCGRKTVTETKHSQAFLVCFLISKTNSGEFHTPTVRLGITQGAQEMLRKVLTIFFLPILQTPRAEDALLEQLPEWGV